MRIRTFSFENKKIAICPHIALTGYESSNLDFSEYEEELEIHCASCEKTHFITIAVN